MYMKREKKKKGTIHTYIPIIYNESADCFVITYYETEISCANYYDYVLCVLSHFNLRTNIILPTLFQWRVLSRANRY